MRGCRPQAGADPQRGRQAGAAAPQAAAPEPLHLSRQVPKCLYQLKRLKIEDCTMLRIYLKNV